MTVARLEVIYIDTALYENVIEGGQMKRFCEFVIEHISIAKPGITTFEVKQ